MAVLTSIALLACTTTKHVPPASGTEFAEPAPWETKEGRVTTKLEMVEALIDAGNEQSALDLISNMRSNDETSTELDVLQAEALRRRGLYEDAERLLLDAIADAPRHAGAHNGLGVLYMDTKQAAKAIPHFEEATRHAEGDPEYFNNLGFAMMAEGRHEEALVPLRRALKLDGSRARTRNNLGFALIAVGSQDEAYRMFRSSLPEADARYNMGLGLEAHGDKKLAVAQYESALEADPGHLEASKALERLQGRLNPSTEQ